MLLYFLIILIINHANGVSNRIQNPLLWNHIPSIVSASQEIVNVEINISMCRALDLAPQLPQFGDGLEQPCYQGFVEFCKREEEYIMATINGVCKSTKEESEDIRTHRDFEYRRQKRSLASYGIDATKINANATITPSSTEALTVCKDFLLGKKLVTDFTKHLAHVFYKMSDFREAVNDLESFYVTDRVVPARFFRTFNLTTGFQFEQMPILKRCQLNKSGDDVKLSMVLEVDKFEKDLQIYESAFFSTLIPDSLKCLIEYNGPRQIVYNSVAKRFCPLKLSASSSPSHSVVRIEQSSCENQEPIENVSKQMSFNKNCTLPSSPKINSTTLVQMHRFKFFNAFYCPHLRFRMVDGKVYACPNKVFALPKDKSITVLTPDGPIDYPRATRSIPSSIDFHKALKAQINIAPSKNYIETVLELQSRSRELIADYELCEYGNKLFLILIVSLLILLFACSIVLIIMERYNSHLYQ